MPKIFITATDTDVGKTHYSVFLIKHWLQQYAPKDIAYIKPFQTGLEHGKKDGEMILKSGLLASNIYTLSQFKMAASPHLAARQANTAINFESLVEKTNQLITGYSHVIVEGSGGLLVPLNHEKMLIDFILNLSLKVILVSRLSLGTINHTLSSVFLLNYYGLKIEKIVLNEYFKSELKEINLDNKNTIESFSGIKTEIFSKIRL